jgi:hypothetical protein
VTRKTRKAGALALGGAGALVAIPAAGGLFSSEALPGFVGAGMLVFLLCCRHALRLCGVDELVFDSRKRGAGAVGPIPDRETEGCGVADFDRGRRSLRAHRAVPKSP